MKHAYRIAGLGLVLGAAVSLAAMPASARGPLSGAFGADGYGARGGLFAATFADLDLNADGQITEEDLLAGAEARLAEIDSDGNGLISAEEFAASAQARIAERMQGRTMGPRGMTAETMAARMAERMIGQRDSDKDGALSLAELAPQTGFARMIDRFDTDDDNAISQAEYDAAKAEMDGRSAKRGDRGDRGNRGGHGGGRW